MKVIPGEEAEEVQTVNYWVFYALPSLETYLTVFNSCLKEIIQQQILELRVSIKSIFDFSQEHTRQNTCKPGIKFHSFQQRPRIPNLECQNLTQPDSDSKHWERCKQNEDRRKFAVAKPPQNWLHLVTFSAIYRNSLSVSYQQINSMYFPRKSLGLSV